MSIIGNILLILALLAALYGGAAFILGARQKNNRLLDRARQAGLAVFWLITLAVTTSAWNMFMLTPV
jgi:cytochrome c biogenesis factor